MVVLGKNLVVIGLIFGVIGVLLLFEPKIPFLRKLPGDIHLKKVRGELYIPLGTCLFLSLIFNGALWLISEWEKK